MVVDCGGGTVDITVHEMESKHGNLTELYKATGGPYGSVGRCSVKHLGYHAVDSLKYKGRHQSLKEILYLYSVKGGGGPPILSCKDSESLQKKQLAIKQMT